MPTPEQIVEFRKHLEQYGHRPSGALTLDQTVLALHRAGEILGFKSRSKGRGGELVVKLRPPNLNPEWGPTGLIDVAWLRADDPREAVATFEVEGYWSATDSTEKDIVKFREAEQDYGGRPHLHAIVLYELDDHEPTTCPNCRPWLRAKADRGDFDALKKLGRQLGSEVDEVKKDAANFRATRKPEFNIFLDRRLLPWFSALPNL